jgi:hypothetical protein
MFKLKDLIEHLEKITKHAFDRHVVWDARYRLGNPGFPPGYQMYRLYLCEWTARGCFLHPNIVIEHKKFVARMGREKGVWWKGHPFLRG